MIGRIAWFAILLGIAGTTAGVQLDRQARKSPELALMVPDFFRSSAQPRITAHAIKSMPPEFGVAEAEKLVRRRPLPARHLRLLAQAKFADDEFEASGLAIQYAAQRGWRDALAQESMMQLSLAADDRPEAARRYAALLLMRRTESALLEDAGSAIFSDPGGKERVVLSQIVSGGRRWHDTFLTRGARVLPPDAFTEIIEMSAANGAQFRCPPLMQAQRVIASKDEALGEQLIQVLRQQC